MFTDPELLSPQQRSSHVPRYSAIRGNNIHDPDPAQLAGRSVRKTSERHVDETLNICYHSHGEEIAKLLRSKPCCQSPCFLIHTSSEGMCFLSTLEEAPRGIITL